MFFRVFVEKKGLQCYLFFEESHTLMVMGERLPRRSAFLPSTIGRGGVIMSFVLHRRPFSSLSRTRKKPKSKVIASLYLRTQWAFLGGIFGFLATWFVKRKMQAHRRFASIAQILTHCACVCVGSLHDFSLPILGLYRGRKVSWAKKNQLGEGSRQSFFPFFFGGKNFGTLTSSQIPFPPSLSCAHGNFRRCFFFHHQSAYSSAGIAMLFFYIFLKKFYLTCVLTCFWHIFF